MGAGELFFAAFAVLGGLALFIFGMNIMTGGLRSAAGHRLRYILARTTRNRMAGIGLGTLLGTLIHSSATTLMLVGFVNAGLMSLAQAVPPVLGANIGTTFSMILISFRLGDYALFMIAVGFALHMIAPRAQIRNFGKAFMGFGLLFLGMGIMSGAIEPYREELAPYLAAITGDTIAGMILGILIAWIITSIIQSSGATIGITFALIDAGAITGFDQVYPIILGAHLGTCVTALLGSIGTNVQAVRTAVSHLLFNLSNVVFALLAKPFFYWLIPLMTDDLKRQMAFLHMMVMLVAAVLVLPFTPHFARLVTLILPSRKPPPQPSFLEEELLKYPEKAIYACIMELQRVARICEKSFRLAGESILFATDRRKIQIIKLNEDVVNEIKISMKHYLSSLTMRFLSRRQALLIQHIDRCITELERIGDHIEAICDMSLRRMREPKALVDEESLDRLLHLYNSAHKVFTLVIESLNPEHADFQGMAAKILEARDQYMQNSINVKSMFTGKVAQRLINPLAGIYFSEYVAAFDRIVRHSKMIALAEKQSQFWIKRKKLDYEATPAPDLPTPKPVDPEDYLDKLHREDYL